jgi:hypothetical protein
MASLHFIVSAPVVAREENRQLGRQVAFEIEVEGSAGIKSNKELVRAACAICANEPACGLSGDTETFGDFTVTETKEITKDENSALRSADWPGVTIWRVSVEPPLAA